MIEDLKFNDKLHEILEGLFAFEVLNLYDAIIPLKDVESFSETLNIILSKNESLFNKTRRQRDCITEIACSIPLGNKTKLFLTTVMEYNAINDFLTSLEKHSESSDFENFIPPTTHFNIYDALDACKERKKELERIMEEEIHYGSTEETLELFNEVLSNYQIKGFTLYR